MQIEDQDKVLVTWAIKTKNGYIVHNQSKAVYAKLTSRGENRSSKGSIDFGENGYWPIEDYTFIKPKHLGHIADYLNGQHVDFAEKNGIWVMFVKPVKSKRRKS